MKDSLPQLTYRPATSATLDDTAVRVNIDRLINSRMLLIANSGGGKSQAIRQILEETHGHVLQIVFDLEGEFVTLREVADVIVAGEGGDVPAHPDVARTLCRRLLTIGASAILNLYDLKLPDRRRFVRYFLEELMSLPRELWRPCLIIIDEAHTVVPERGSGEAESTDAVITLCTQGRKRGFSAILATQRISKLHKDAAAELLNKLIGRTSLDIDVKRAANELGLERSQWSDLKTLKPGEFFVHGPAISDDIVRVRTGHVKTKPPKHAEFVPLSNRNSVLSLLIALGDLPALAKEDAQSIEQLKAQVVTLTQQLKSSEYAPAMRRLEQEAERMREELHTMSQSRARAVSEVAKDTESRWRQSLEGLAESIRRELANLPALRGDGGTQISGTNETVPIDKLALRQFLPRVTERETAKRVPAKHKTPQAATPSVPQTPTLSATQRRMLVAIATITRMGVVYVDKAMIGTWCGLSWTGGSFSNNITALRKANVVEDGPDKTLILTEAGMMYVHGDVSPINSQSQLHELWLAKIGGTAKRMLEHLIAIYPRDISREDLANAVGVVHTGGSYSNNLSTLRTCGVLTDVGRDVKASPILFPRELPR